jgi:hypothetical protein
MNVIAVMGAFDQWSAVLGRARAEVKDVCLPGRQRSCLSQFLKWSLKGKAIPQTGRGAMTDQDWTGPNVSRRDMLVAAASLAVTGGASAEPAPDAQTSGIVNGIVFETNERNEKGSPLNGVLVSNGRDVVRTGLDGGYSLPVESGMAIFVVKPAGYAVPFDPSTRLPLFSYVHQPEGTPANLNLTFKGLAPTGPLPPSVDFGLIKKAEPKTFDVILFTDPQPESEAEVDYIRDDVVNDLVGVNAAFGITAGDIMFDDLSLYGRYNRIIAQIGLPWWNIGGNHDLNFESPDSRFSRETYKRVFGAPY